MKNYRGTADGTVYVEGEDDSERRLLDPRLDLYNHSSTGFAWGYLGSGPAQLALALLADALENDHEALRLYQEYKFRVIAMLPDGQSWGPVSIGEIQSKAHEIAKQCCR